MVPLSGFPVSGSIKAVAGGVCADPRSSTLTRLENRVPGVAQAVRLAPANSTRARRNMFLTGGADRNSIL